MMLPAESFHPRAWRHGGKCKQCARPRYSNHRELKLCTGTCGGGELPIHAFAPWQWEPGRNNRKCKKCVPPRMRKGELRCGAAECGAIQDEKEFTRCLGATPSKRRKKTLRCNDCVAKEATELLEKLKKS